MPASSFGALHFCVSAIIPTADAPCQMPAMNVAHLSSLNGGCPEQMTFEPCKKQLSIEESRDDN